VNETAGRAYHVGMSREPIVAAAVDLTREHGLFGWSVRDLAKALEITPSVIYHHVGGRDLLCKHVVEAVTLAIPFSPEPRPWRQWMRETLYPMRAHLAAAPGVAKWLLLHGPLVPVLLTVVDSGIESLRRSGFGDNAPTVYAVMMSTATQIIAAGDDRRQHADDGPRDHESMMAEFAALSPASPGLEALMDGYTSRFTGSDAAVEATRQAHYELVLEALMDGLEKLRVA
jgi:AcrR family transcriptional regulator